MSGERENRRGYAAGVAAGSWVIDGNTSVGRARDIIAGFDDGDPVVMDLCPNPLSGEWGGESITELLGDDFTDADADAYEAAFADGFWDEVLRAAEEAIGD